MGRASDRSRALASMIGEERTRLEDQRSSFTADLVGIVAGNTSKENELADEASRAWWVEASAGLARLFSECVGGARDCRKQNQNRNGGDKSGAVVCGGREGLPTGAAVNNGGAVDGDGGGGVGVGSAESETPAAANPAAALLMTLLNNMNRTEERRSEKNAADVAAETGPLRLAVEEKRLLQEEAIHRCESALEAAAAEGSPLAVVREEASAAVEAAAPAAAVPASPPTGERESGDDDGKQLADERDTGGCGDVDGLPSAEELDRFRTKLEADTVELAAASFDDEVRGLAIDEKDDVPSAATLGCSTFPHCEPPRELTRSQLDLRRTAEIRAYARSLGGMLLRARKGLAEEMLQVISYTCSRTPSGGCAVGRCWEACSSWVPVPLFGLSSWLAG